MVFGILLAFFAIGTKLLYSAFHFIYTTFLGSLLGRNINLTKCGPWAVVTGATDGLGKAFVKKMASAGLNVALISRNPSKLEAVAKELKNKYERVEFKTIAVDFTDGRSIYPKLKDELSGLEIGMLVNNVGMEKKTGEPFHTLEEDSIHDMINCNIRSTVEMCHLILPQMIQRKKGVIINIGSILSAIPTPRSIMYAATKAFTDKFSGDLAAEVRPFGVTVQVVHPGLVKSNMTRQFGFIPTFLFVEPDTFVDGTMRTLGLEDRTGGHWFHKILLYAYDLVSYFVPRRLFTDPLAIRGWKLLARKRGEYLDKVNQQHPQHEQTSSTGGKIHSS